MADIQGLPALDSLDQLAPIEEGMIRAEKGFFGGRRIVYNDGTNKYIFKAKALYARASELIQEHEGSYEDAYKNLDKLSKIDQWAERSFKALPRNLFHRAFAYIAKRLSNLKFNRDQPQEALVEKAEAIASEPLLSLSKIDALWFLTHHNHKSYQSDLVQALLSKGKELIASEGIVGDWRDYRILYRNIFTLFSTYEQYLEFEKMAQEVEIPEKDRDTYETIVREYHKRQDQKEALLECFQEGIALDNAEVWKRWKEGKDLIHLDEVPTTQLEPVISQLLSHFDVIVSLKTLIDPFDSLARNELLEFRDFPIERPEEFSKEIQTELHDISEIDYASRMVMGFAKEYGERAGGFNEHWFEALMDYEPLFKTPRGKKFYDQAMKMLHTYKTSLSQPNKTLDDTEILKAIKQVKAVHPQFVFMTFYQIEADLRLLQQQYSQGDLEAYEKAVRAFKANAMRHIHPIDGYNIFVEGVMHRFDLVLQEIATRKSEKEND